MAAPSLTPVATACAAPPPAPANRNQPSIGGPREAAIDSLARTLWGEARLEPVRGIEAVASVVLNRVAVATERGGWWWGDGIVAVCRHPEQFSCWNPDGADAPRLLAIKAGEPVFDTCLRVARRAVAGVLPDITHGATHYHPATAHPAWSASELPSAEVGGNLFYRIVG